MRPLRLTPLRLVAGILLGPLSLAGTAYAASLGLSSKSLHAWTQTLTKATCNQTSTTADDTFVQQASPTSTAGATATTLTIKPTSGSQDYAFLRFNLSGCGLPTTGGADSAVLTVRVTTSGSDTISVFPVTTSWSSSTLNWNGLSGLSVGSTATGTFSASSTGNKTVTVTADVDTAIKAGALWGWELRATAGTATVAIGAAENATSANRPSMTLSDEK
ncbi:MAG TPA: DNRLRE domain-containing protein [Gaiellaceae bacterium]